MSSVIGNHTMDLLYLLKENLKNLIFDLLIRGRSFQNLSYLSSLFVVKKMEIPKNTLERITRYWIRPCLHKSIGGRLPIHFTLSSSMLKNKRIFSLVIWKLMSPFSVWPYNLVQPKIISTNIFSKNNSRSLWVIISLILLTLRWVSRPKDVYNYIKTDSWS